MSRGARCPAFSPDFERTVEFLGPRPPRCLTECAGAAAKELSADRPAGGHPPRPPHPPAGGPDTTASLRRRPPWAARWAACCCAARPPSGRRCGRAGRAGCGGRCTPCRSCCGSRGATGTRGGPEGVRVWGVCRLSACVSVCVSGGGRGGSGCAARRSPGSGPTRFRRNSVLQLFFVLHGRQPWTKQRWTKPQRCCFHYPESFWGFRAPGFSKPTLKGSLGARTLDRTLVFFLDGEGRHLLKVIVQLKTKNRKVLKKTEKMIHQTQTRQPSRSIYECPVLCLKVWWLMNKPQTKEATEKAWQPAHVVTEDLPWKWGKLAGCHLLSRPNEKVSKGHGKEPGRRRAPNVLHKS